MAIPDITYRIVCYELDAGQQTAILDVTATAFIAITGTLDENGTMRGAGTNAGPKPLLKRLAAVIADDEYLTD